MKSFRNNRGFTLIEVIIVIILLGVLMIVFGKKIGNLFTSNNTKGVAYNVIDDLRSIDDAAQGYTSSTTTEAATLAILTTSGNLNNTPVPQEAGMVTPPGSYTLDTTTYTTLGPTAAADTVVYLDGVTQQVCSEINKKALGTTTISTTLNTTAPLQCMDNSGTYRVIKLLYPH